MKTDAMLARAHITRTMSYDTWRPCLWKYFDQVFSGINGATWGWVSTWKVHSPSPSTTSCIMCLVQWQSTSMKFYTEVALLNTTTYTSIALIISFFSWFRPHRQWNAWRLLPVIFHTCTKSHTLNQNQPLFSVSGYSIFYASCLL